jgi:hypothetical protein
MNQKRPLAGSGCRRWRPPHGCRPATPILGGDLRQLLVLGRHLLEADVLCRFGGGNTNAVSCTGRSPGIITYDATATATVAPKPSRISRWWPSAHCRLRS